MAMQRSELSQELHEMCTTLVQRFQRIEPAQWSDVTTFFQLTIFDLLNYTMSVLELSGNWYLQSLRMESELTTALVHREAIDLAIRRRNVPLETAQGDLLAAQKSLLVLFDMAEDRQLAGLYQGETRFARFVILQKTLQRVCSSLPL